MANVENPNSEANQAEPITEQIHTELSYQRADGTIEKATTREEAIAKCPYLGRLPLEQANVLLELSRKGQEMMAAASPKPEVIEPVKEVVLAPKEKVPAVAKSKKTETINIAETMIAPEITIALQEEYLNPEPVLASKELDTILKEVKETLLAPKVDLQDSVSENVVTEKTVIKPVIKDIVNESTPRISNLKEVSHPVDAIQIEQTEPIKIELPAEDKLPLEESIDPNVQEATPELIEIQPNSENETLQLPEEITIIHEQTESKVEPEAVFEQLIEMLSLPEADYIEIDISPSLQPNESYGQEASIEKSLLNEFESYINIQPVEETVPTIDQIQAKAENQPLEASLSELVSLLAEASPQNETLITEIFELTKIFSANEDKASIIKFNPEMLSKILSLLELIGYENPERSLLDLVARYDLRFLISAMRYLHELSDPRKRHEFSITTFLNPLVGAIINPLAGIIGKTVIRFVNA